ncbi:MAG: transcription elongation factor GreA [Bacteroidia bacterium]
MSEKTYLTKEGMDRLTNELNELKTVGRKEAANAIQKAREMGDLSENAEYDAAKDAQGLLELRISKLENILATARLIDTSEMEEGKVYILSKVKLRNVKTKREMTYTLVAEEEASLAEGKLSIKSPVGKALLGKEKGDRVIVEIPAGQTEFDLLEVTLDIQ